MRDRLTSVIEALGLGIAVTGIAMIHAPTAYIVGGLTITALGWLGSR